MRVPIYFYTDDNFMVLKDYHPDFGAYNLQAVRSVLTKFKGVLLTSRPLADYYEMLQLHPSTIMVQPILDELKLAKLNRLAMRPASTSVLRIAFIGGDFRRVHLRERVIPALSRINKDTSLELFTRLSPNKHEELKQAGISVTEIELNSFDKFLVRWRRLQPDVLVHPEADYANAAYKTANVLLIALYLRCIPIVCNEEAYHNAEEKSGILKVDGSVESWERALRKAQDAQFRAMMLLRLEHYCRENFAPKFNLVALDRILAESARTDILTWAERIRRIALPKLNFAHLTRIARMEAELSSRAYRVALKLRKGANVIRSARAWLRNLRKD